MSYVKYITNYDVMKLYKYVTFVIIITWEKYINWNCNRFSFVRDTVMAQWAGHDFEQELYFP